MAAGYRESLDDLYGLQRFGIKLGLENIRTLLARLGHPEEAFPVLHVGGTNGKGSVCAALAAIVGAAGLRTGLYTSPHLHSFTERIRVDGRAIAEAEVVRLAARLRQVGEGVPATFFEVTTAMALEHFRAQKVGAAVLEVGMGGRLDATNAVLPRVSVVTSICRDHAEHLGADLAAIAAEKGGIIKPGVPVVIAPQEPEALAVLLDLAAERGAPVRRAGTDFSWRAEGDLFSFVGRGLTLAGLRPGLAGRHQLENLSLALAAAEVLQEQGWPLSPAALRRGIESVRWPGRLEWWEDGRQVLLDGAHNGGGARALSGYLAEQPLRFRAVVGVKGDKAPAEILAPLISRFTALYATRPPVETSVEPAVLAGLAAAAGVPARSFERPEEALAAAFAERQEGEAVVVAGSLFLVAAARDYLQSGKDDPKG